MHSNSAGNKLNVLIAAPLEEQDAGSIPNDTIGHETGDFAFDHSRTENVSEYSCIQGADGIRHRDATLRHRLNRSSGRSRRRL